MERPSDRPPPWRERLGRLLHRLPLESDIEEAVQVADSDRAYLPWADLRHRPVPEGWTAEDVWAVVKSRRMIVARRLEGLRDRHGQPFLLVVSASMNAALHRLDTRERLWRSVRGDHGIDVVSDHLMAAIEEAHHSSMIEGAVTTRRRSRALIRAGEEPRGQDERMVLNTFRTLERVREWSDQPLTPSMVLEIQALVCEGTLADDQALGRLRQDDGVFVVDSQTQDVVHAPPRAVELPERLERLCAFANADGQGGDFLHPLVRAALLHHQLAYDHPFEDGNGRSARALFMWAVLHAGYRWFEALSISRAIARAKVRYYRSFRLVQGDDGDTTYFVRDQLRAVETEVAQLARFLRARAALERWLAERRALEARLNTRQLALIDHALRDPDAVFTAREHQQYHGVSQPTAWKDLTRLTEQGLLTEARQGRKALYQPSDELRRLARDRPPRLRRE